MTCVDREDNLGKFWVFNDMAENRRYGAVFGTSALQYADQIPHQFP